MQNAIPRVKKKQKQCQKMIQTTRHITVHTTRCTLSPFYTFSSNKQLKQNKSNSPTVYILVVTLTSSFPRFTSSTTLFNNCSQILADSIVYRRACDVMSVVIRLTSSGVSGGSDGGLVVLLLVVEVGMWSCCCCSELCCGVVVVGVSSSRAVVRSSHEFWLLLLLFEFAWLLLLALLVLAPSVDVDDVAAVVDEIDVASRLSILVVVAFIARESDVTEDVTAFCCCSILEVWPLAIIVVAALWK